ncbi:ABC transporter permease [Methanobrevibacter olleyae]|uniref:Molybdate ABC transporter permease protein n=1 Tax=Methanobrevibacter olleyae TaxID=294671 RepID=A0A126QZ04_METOL|nr:ABC transporter permease [Methanobrevibacter olleyae]AMK14605.1 molybdate ABC transporter permease protein [Methanobrevibacter olleyae]SFL27156.1 molybdate transport system permease protein [Methanobrevibacter olleyae]
MKSKFEIGFIAITVIITALLFLVIGSMFLIPSYDGFINSLFSSEMLFAIWLTITTALCSATLVVLTCIPMAYTLSRYDFPLKSLFKVILDLPMAFPEIVIGIALLMFLGNYGIGGFLDDWGIQLVFNNTGIIIAQYFVALPYAIKMLHSTFNYIDPRYEFVSRSLGYSETETFLKITLPLSKQGLFATIIITLARCIGTFAAVLFVGGGILMKTETLAVSMYLQLSTGDIDMAITAGILLVIISFITIAIMEKYASDGHNENLQY